VLALNGLVNGASPVMAQQSRGVAGKILLASAGLMGLAGGALVSGLVALPSFDPDVQVMIGGTLLVAAGGDLFLALRFLGEPQG
jgi:hypothetical protein